MARPVKTQWEFGELFPREPIRKVLSVSELTAQVRRSLEKEFGQVWVSGELTNLRVQGSGHIYFTLKDAGAQLNCVLFRGEDGVDRARLQDGRKVTLGGEMTVYEPRGQYQLRVTAVELEGIGALQVAFEKLKQKLKAEGLFAAERKRPLPRYPQRIGLVTSATGAAIRDVLHVVHRRNPGLEIVLAPCRVQGDGAAGEIAAAIRLLNAFSLRASRPATPFAEGQVPPARDLLPLDLILVTRGGGSLEDLWAFNEEIVARAVFESALPVVSAIGHEIDFTIVDFVADLRAATPSAAAELITEGVFSSGQFLAEATRRLGQLARKILDDKRCELEHTGLRLGRVHPRRKLGDGLQRLDEAQTSLLRAVSRQARDRQVLWRNLADRLGRLRPALVLRQRQEICQQFRDRLSAQVRQRLKDLRNRAEASAARLRLLGPEQVLARGYSITRDAETGAVLRDASTVKPGARLKSRLADGEVRSRVEH